jgi:DNA-directed RNA polymerase beta' subunit
LLAIIDKIKAFGYKYATISGTTWNIDAVKVPKEKDGLVNQGWTEAAQVENSTSLFRALADLLRNAEDGANSAPAAQF